MSDEQAYYALTQKAFSFLAPAYEFMTLPLATVRQRVVDFAQARPGMFVLDVATGTGQQAFAFARRGCRVVGVDITEAMLRIARRHNQDSRVRFEQVDASNLRFADDSFDMTCISFALHDMPSAIGEKVLREMARVTRSNGAVIIVDYALPYSPIARALLYGFVSLYESHYYREFIRSDLSAMVARAGVEVAGELQVLLGAGHILRGRKQGL